MDSPARRRLQRPFSEIPVDRRFQMVNNVMKAAIPGSQIFKKIDETSAESNGVIHQIRPEWPCEELST